MKGVIDGETLHALRQYGDAATQEFMKRLRERRLCTTRCRRCGEAAWPPRPFCPSCFADDVEWFDLPAHGALHAFTQQERSTRFGKPDVIGIVECGGFLVVTRIDAPFESLRIGQAVEVAFVEVSPEIVLHQFRPV